jgi:putative ABC transport system permease protein
MSGHRSHLSVLGLLRRQFLAGPGASIALAVLVLVGAFLATVVPRAVAALHDAALDEHLAQ